MTDENKPLDTENQPSAAPEITPESSDSLDMSQGEDKPDEGEVEKAMSFIDQVVSGPFLTNIIMAGLFANFLMIHYNDYNTTPKFSSLLLMVQVSCLVLFFLIRVAPKKVSMDPKDWILAIVGTALPMLVMPVAEPNEIVLLLLLQLFGIFISIVAIISLNTSFGVVPALRNVKTGGLYALIRHPIYFGYFIFMTCVVIINFSIPNLVVLLGIIGADIYRILAEEKILSEDDAYSAYKSRVRYRLIPFVW